MLKVVSEQLSIFSPWKFLENNLRVTVGNRVPFRWVRTTFCYCLKVAQLDCPCSLNSMVMSLFL